MRGGAEALLVLQESEDEVAAALVVAEGITRSHPSLPAWLRSKQAAGEILTEQHTFLQHLGDAGERSERLRDELLVGRPSAAQHWRRSSNRQRCRAIVACIIGEFSV